MIPTRRRPGQGSPARPSPRSCWPPMSRECPRLPDGRGRSAAASGGAGGDEEIQITLGMPEPLASPSNPPEALLASTRSQAGWGEDRDGDRGPVRPERRRGRARRADARHRSHPGGISPCARAEAAGLARANEALIPGPPGHPRPQRGQAEDARHLPGQDVARRASRRPLAARGGGGPEHPSPSQGGPPDMDLRTQPGPRGDLFEPVG